MLTEPTTTFAGITLVAPCSIRCDGRTINVGFRLYLVIRSIRSARGRLSSGRFVRAVWPDKRTVKPNAISTTLHRVNAVLKELDRPERVGQDCGWVVLV